MVKPWFKLCQFGGHNLLTYFCVAFRQVKILWHGLNLKLQLPIGLHSPFNLYTIISNNTLTNRWIHVSIIVPTYALYCIWKETFVLCSTIRMLNNHKESKMNMTNSYWQSKKLKLKNYQIVTSDVMLCICGQYVDVHPSVLPSSLETP